MRTLYCLLGLLLSPWSLAQGDPSPLDLTNPASFETRQTCLTECERVFADCQAQCEDTSARAHERHFETPDLPVAECIRVCEENLGLCRKDC